MKLLYSAMSAWVWRCASTNERYVAMSAKAPN
jgi:hypothetical protein